VLHVSFKYLVRCDGSSILEKSSTLHTNDHSEPFLERRHSSLSVRDCGDIINSHSSIALLKVYIALLWYAFEGAVSCAKVEYGGPTGLRYEVRVCLICNSGVGGLPVITKVR
jgi:hypothetical protein